MNYDIDCKMTSVFKHSLISPIMTCFSHPAFKSDSPGPAYGVDPMLGPRGRENRPSYSFGIRPRTPGIPHQH